MSVSIRMKIRIVPVAPMNFGSDRMYIPVCKQNGFCSILICTHQIKSHRNAYPCFRKC